MLDQAIAHYRARRLHEAEVQARKIVEREPRSVAALNLLGNIAHDVGRNDLAILWFQRAIAIDSRSGWIFNNLGEAYRAIMDVDRATACYQAAIQRDPNDPLPQNNLAILLAQTGQLDDAIEVWKKLIERKPDHVQAHNNLGNALLERGMPREAVTFHRRAVELNPTDGAAHSNLLRDLGHLIDISPKELLDEHRRWWEMHGKPLASNIAPHANNRDPDRKLRIGWVSGDFREHAVAFFIEPIFAHHDRNQLQFFAYSDLPVEDAVTARLKNHVHAWRSIRGLPDEQVVGMVRQDQIDVLIDLAGHTATNRMKLFAHQPAPVQISYLGYPCTTGVETIQYRLTDALSDPVGMTEDHYAEELIRLPRTAWCYRPPADAPDVSDLPSITRGYITFGSFNSFSKVNERVIETWANILLQMPNSRLYLKTNGLGDASVQRRVADAFAAHGVDESRLTMRGKDITIPEHLSRYHEIDIALDTFPYNGTTTTCEALSMGVPVVTIAGDRHMSRVGVSLLNSVGLTELIAEDLQTYVQIAVNLAADIDRLRSLRHDLRERMNRSPLRDEAGFTGEFDESIRQLWRRWCAHPPI